MDAVAVDDYKKAEAEPQAAKPISQFNKEFLSIFDWENEFYYCLKDQPEYTENLAYLNEGLAQEHWKKKFTKRASGFFFFITQLCNYIQRAVVIKDGIPYDDIPGYQKIIKTFILELKNRDIKTYPDSLIEASIETLANQRLLGPYCSIVLQQTR